ncbi:hypothetical protein RirG_157030 [Rhizophagus irregularis DAOM 197198w]|nr:hypothetical protein RirG_157030 [Rhizophagus irregularis DAOM 197198w]
MIKTGNWIPDELHVMLRITDVLLGCFFYQLMEDINQFKKSTSTLIEQEMHRIGITHFQFYESKTKGKYDWTTLNGVEKLNVLKNFEVTRSVSGDHGRKMEFLWHEFLRLYLFLRQDHITEEEIDSFEQAAKSWILKFCEPTIGKSNSANKKKKGMFNPTDITPYMHIFAHYIPQFFRILKSKNLQFKHFSTSSLEKKNHMHVWVFFGATTMGGGNKANSVVHNILTYENRQLYFLMNNIPKSIVQKTIVLKE